jgi:hypothetical protein
LWLRPAFADCRLPTSHTPRQPQNFYTVFGQLLVWMTPSQPMAQILGSTLSFIFNITNGFT